jgi:hypothetical protein
MLGDTLKAILVLGTLLFNEASAVDAQEALCDQAAKHAARQTGVPAEVLYALTRTETGRARKGRLQPWPWTVNIQGKGYWFATKSEALTFATLHFDSGARSFDVGCFQVNFRWHGEAFNSIADMFDPKMNAMYAAGFLSELKQVSQGWEDAAGAYHSRTPELKAKYQARFEDIFASVQGQEITPPMSRPLSGNRYPLLKRNQSPSRLGSLFGGETGERKPLFTFEAKS